MKGSAATIRSGYISLVFWIAVGVLPNVVLFATSPSPCRMVAMYPHFFLHHFIVAGLAAWCLCRLIDYLYSSDSRNVAISACIGIAVIMGIVAARTEECTPAHGLWKFSYSALTKRVDNGSTVLEAILAGTSQSRPLWEQLESDSRNFGWPRPVFTFAIGLMSSFLTLCFGIVLLFVVACFKGNFEKNMPRSIDGRAFLYLFGLILCGALWIPMRMACDIEKHRILNLESSFLWTNFISVIVVILFGTLASAFAAWEFYNEKNYAIVGTALVAATLSISFIPDAPLLLFGVKASPFLWAVYLAMSASVIVAFWSLPLNSVNEIPRTNPHSVEWLLLTAIHEEYNAACNQLKNKVPLSEWSTPATLGVIGATNVICVFGGKGSTSTAAALQYAADHCNAKSVIMVGIAGGMPARGIYRGDVVIGNSILAYDFGKLKDGKYILRPECHLQSDVYLVRHAQVSSSQNTNHWQERITTQRPDGKPASDSNVHTGYIASGDKIIDDFDHSYIRDIGKALPEIDAFEMEAAGASAVVRLVHAYRVFRFLIIKGISDEVRSGQEKRNVATNSTQVEDGKAQRAKWRYYAADCAASLACKVIEDISTSTEKSFSTPLNPHFRRGER